VLACRPIGRGFESLLELTFFNIFSKFDNKYGLGLGLRVRVRFRVWISDLLAYITYFIVTVIIRFVQREANLAAAGTLSPRIACRLPARYTNTIRYMAKAACRHDCCSSSSSVHGHRSGLVLGTGTRVPGSLPVTRVPGQDPGTREFLLPGCCPLTRLRIWCN